MDHDFENFADGLFAALVNMLVSSSYLPAYLGDDCEADCEAGYEVGDGEVEVVVGEPVRDGQLAT